MAIIWEMYGFGVPLAVTGLGDKGKVPPGVLFRHANSDRLRQTPQYQAREHPRMDLFEWIESWHDRRRRPPLVGSRGCTGSWADWQKETLSQQDHSLGCTELAGIETIKVCPRSHRQS